MGVEEQTNEVQVNGEGVNGGSVDSSPAKPAAPQAPPPEEPPKMEEIVTQEVMDIVAKGYKSDMKCVSFQAELGSKAGDNYMSIMYAVDMELENVQSKEKETLKIMLKTIPRSIFRAEMINEMKAFGKESLMYKTVFPGVMQVQEKKGIPKDLQFESWPRCYAAHVDGATDFLAMENLRVDGYKMGNRKEGLDFNHCSVVLQQLARYHALSYAKFGGHRDSIVEAFPMLGAGMFDKTIKNAEMTAQFFAQSFKSQSESLLKMGEHLAASRMEKLSKADFTTMLGDLTEKNIDVAVISHGDCWENNFLFGYDVKDTDCRLPTKIKFLDFQLTSATSRLVDVYYFLLTSCKLDVLGEYERDLLMIYYSSFTSFVQALGVNTTGRGLTWENFLKEGDRFRLYGVCLGLLLGPMLAADSSDIPDMDAYTEEDMANPEKAARDFFNDMTKSSALKKAKILVLEHLPKCVGAEQFL